MDLYTYILTGLHGLQVLLSLTACVNGLRFLSSLRAGDEPTTVLKTETKEKGAADEGGVTSAHAQARRTRNIAIRSVAAALLSLLPSAYKIVNPHPEWTHLGGSVLLVGLLMGTRGRLLAHYQRYRPRDAPPIAAAYPSTHQHDGSELDSAERLAGLLSYLEITWIAGGLLGAWTLRPVR